MSHPKSLRVLGAFLFLASTASVAAAQNSLAESALLEGRADDAIRLLHAHIADHPTDARPHLLLCRVLLSEQLADAATPECDAAAANAPNSSEVQLWLGRAYGARASAANPLYAFQLARKVHAAFERAVQLDSNSGPALSDLGEYYVQAPAIVGGGVDKARALAARMMATQPARAHRLLAQIAEHTGDLQTAEAEFRNVGQTTEALIDLAQFYQTHGQPDRSLSTVKAALAVDHLHGPELVDAAHILTKAGRAPDLAETCLQQYLVSPARSDAAPAFRVHVQLGRLMAARGDSGDAAAEYAAARSLASGYAPHTATR